jgi:hypothetical protein
MTKYIRQTRRTTCGPVAVLNALKWAGYNFTRESHFNKLCKELQWSPYHKMGYVGTHPYYIRKTLEKYPKIRTLYTSNCIDIKDLDRCLDFDDFSFIIRYFYKLGKETIGHYVFCPKRTLKKYIFINDKYGKTIMYRSRSTMSNRLKQTSDCGFTLHQPYVWLLQRSIKRI